MMMFDILGLLGQYVCFFILHVCGGGAFPKPLSEKKEREYLEKFHQGDMQARKPLTFQEINFFIIKPP